jgi:hypothetical protein
MENKEKINYLLEIKKRLLESYNGKSSNEDFQKWIEGELKSKFYLKPFPPKEDFDAFIDKILTELETELEGLNLEMYSIFSKSFVDSIVKKIDAKIKEIQK